MLGLLLTAIAWGCVPVFQKLLLMKMTPVQVVFSRFFLSGVIFFIWTIVIDYKELLSVLKNNFFQVLLVTIFGPLLGMILINYGLQRLPVSIVGVLSAFELVFVYLIATMAKQEKWSYKRLFSVLVAVIGVIIIIYSRAHVASLDLSFWYGILVVTIANVILALNTVFSKSLIPHCSPAVFMAGSFLIGSLCLIPFVGENYLTMITQLDFEMWFSLLFCVLIATVFGFTMWYYALKSVSPTGLSTTMCLVPVIAFAGGVIFFDEYVSIVKIIGLVIVLIGLYLVNIKYKFAEKDMDSREVNSKK